MTILIAESSQKTPVAEAYRTLRTNIQFSNFDKELKSIVITSAMNSEGKTTTISNLGIVAAKSGKKVLIVDADLRKPTLHLCFNVPNFRGLSELLLEEGDLIDYITKSQVEGLNLLLSGAIPPNPSEMLGSNRMKVLAGKLKDEYDLVLYDAPPVGMVTDAQILATIADGTILVLRAGKTNKRAADYAVSLLRNVNANVIGTVLNCIKDNGRGYYSNKHYYDYRSNYNPEEKASHGLFGRKRRGKDHV
jgi:capsular exopolysaccharide synthesis family protein